MLTALVSRKGGRAANEDAAGRTRKNGILCAVAADGLGGHKGGAMASEIAVKSVLDAFNESPSFSSETVGALIDIANDAITERAEAEMGFGQMSSTIAVLLVKGRRAVWGNVGDTRIYRLHHNRIEEVTEDHSLAFMSFLCGDIEYDDIRRSSDQNKLTSALGIASGEVNISRVVEIDNDTSFLLCTDGWWEYVPDRDIERTLSESKTAGEWLERMLEIRESAAPELSDNYTAAAVII